MALKIEERYSTAMLQSIVKRGHAMFFRTYGQIGTPYVTAIRRA
jgi:hypothetical protein